MNSIFLILRERLTQAISTYPSFARGQDLIWVISLYVLFTMTLGWRSGFLRWAPQSQSIIVRVMLTSLIAPAILEELIFRGLLLPYPANSISLESYIGWAGFSLGLFIIYHPLNAVTFFPQARVVFFNPVFLILAAALGLVCTITYWQTASLWIPVIIHWLAVVLWLLCFGGWEKIENRET
ncbi:MAG: CPBP family glutamic-type intramembrane protease [Cyanobacteria bacterium P01_G01_bin.67]